MAEQFEQRPGSGILFKNKTATDENKQPNYTGTGKLLDGTAFDMSGWVKQGKAGNFLSLAFKAPFEPNKTKPGNAIDESDPF